ncbi:flagellar hook-associated protein FlgK [Methylobacterium sp. 1030]|uniref:flagellar hook-associated protein FlgK n=1 Tax=Methylobacterium sp. 1030 TaxID=3156404 RepID=UPI00339B1696
MGLTLSLNAARSSLIANASQMAIVSRNTTSLDDPSYSRKIASLVTGNGQLRVVVSRASDAALYERMIGSTSELAGRQALLKGLTRLADTVGDTAGTDSVAAKVGILTKALGTYAERPDDANLAKAAIAAAKDLAAGLNEASRLVQSTRLEADQEVAASVGTINDLLGQFDAANRAVVAGTAAGGDISDALDQRDKIVAELSQQIGVSAVTRAGNDVALYADNGVTLFDRSARSVVFEPTNAFTAGTVGGVVKIDGVAVTGENSPMPLATGRIVGLMQVRDEAAVTYQEQFDTIAQGLIEAFAETDNGTPGTGPALAGLFTHSGGPALPTTADLPGLASRIGVNAAADPSVGGDPFRLRDGGMNAGAGYAYNADGAASFADRLQALQAALATPRSYPADSGLPVSGTLQAAASASASWLEATRKAASSQVDSEAAFLQSASTALSNATGVNRDDETATMLQLEKSYAASAKLLATVNAMLQTLLDSVR